MAAWLAASEGGEYAAAARFGRGNPWRAYWKRTGRRKRSCPLWQRKSMAVALEENGEKKGESTGKERVERL
jgi:hypothetical protein